MKAVIDRFEGKYAVCEHEDGSMINISREKLPQEAKEGDAIMISDDNIIADKKRTSDRKKMIAELTKDLWE